ncbi:MAG: 23S rRNA (pseudouridine(1915)-N(3))-methyltransferase RlmH [Alphaproteobacteria bacterium]|nr:23S rRNA (pseudouridine(1915)-N(3))-methyltransferase RlmH [Alphaproteobacteria bacterium]
MRITVIAVGRARKGPEHAVFEHFARRLSWPIAVKEVEERRPLPVADRVRSEGEKLRAHIPEGARTVALDGGGRPLTSEAFAARLGDWQDQGIGDIAFVIGGADGLDPAIKDGADLVLSLGAMTWPHLLVRGMLAEQLYRAEQIRAGHPYHRAGPPPGRGRPHKP